MTNSRWRLQFRLSGFFLAVTVLAVVFGVFGAPLEVQEVVIYLIAWVASSLVLTGIVYARDLRRAFFIGASSPLVGAWYLELSRASPILLLVMMMVSVICGVCSVGLAWWLTRDHG